MPNYIRCKTCGKVIGEYDESGQPVFNGRHVLIPLTRFILCKGDARNPCNTVNWVEPERLEMRGF
jgi:hypothetical protein